MASVRGSGLVTHIRKRLYMGETLSLPLTKVNKKYFKNKITSQNI